MKYSFSLLVISTFISLPIAHAAVTIKLPSNTEPLLLNSLPLNEQQVTTENGTQQIVFKYLGGYRQQGQRQGFTSDPVIVTFTGQDTNYTIALPTINSAKDANKFNQSPSIIIRDENGKSVDYHIDTLTKDGIQLGRNYQQEIKAYNLTSAPAAVLFTKNDAQPLTSPSSSQITTVDKLNTEQIDVGKMLDFWYQQADEQTRKAFKARIKER
jgi:hypothetical protein